MNVVKINISKITLRRLKWVTIVAPIAFLIIFDYFRHFVFPSLLQSPAGFALIYATVVVAVVIFSEMVFRLVQGMQNRIARQNEELTSISEITKSLSLTLETSKILENSLRQVMTLSQANAGVIYLLDAERAELFSTASAGFSPRVIEMLRRQKLGDEPIGTQVVKTGIPVIIPNIQEYGDPRLAKLALEEGFLSSLSYPLTSQDKVLGVLALAAQRKNAFPESSLGLISGVANQVAMAVDRSTLFRESFQRAQDIATVNEVSAVASSSLDLREVMKAVLLKVIDLLHLDAGGMWLWEETTQEMVMVVHAGSFAAAFREITRFKKGEGFPGLVAETGEVVISPDIAQDERFLRDKVRKAGIHSFVSVPLKAKGKVVGAMDLATSEYRHLTPRELNLLTAIGNQIGMAIENARLYEKVQELAVVEERGRIAREMHDGVAQLLGYANAKALAARRFLEIGKAGQALEQLSQLGDAAKRAYADVREAILSLRSTLGQRQGFLSTLEEYLENFYQMSGVPVVLETTPENGSFDIDPRIELQLIRIIQEALSNVRKHSNADRAWVTLEARDKELKVEIRDNGRGFNPSKTVRGGLPRFGLQTMQERAQAIGGCLQIESRPGLGTKVMVDIPLALERQETDAHIAR